MREFLFITVRSHVDYQSIFLPYLALGFKSGYSISAGYPQVRVLNARKFAEFKGFLKFVEVLKRPDCPWVGCDVLVNILQLAHSMEVSIIIIIFPLLFNLMLFILFII